MLCQSTSYPRYSVKVLLKPNKSLLFYFVFPLSCQTEMILCPENERCLVDRLVIVHSITPWRDCIIFSVKASCFCGKIAFPFLLFGSSCIDLGLLSIVCPDCHGTLARLAGVNISPQNWLQGDYKRIDPLDLGLLSIVFQIVMGLWPSSQG